MTKKRFTCKENLLFDNGYYTAHMMKFEDIVDLLNKLNEENIELKEAMKRLMIEMMGTNGGVPE